MYKRQDLGLPHKDPADRFIVATALANDALLVTADQTILGLSLIHISEPTRPY